MQLLKAADGAPRSPGDSTAWSSPGLGNQGQSPAASSTAPGDQAQLAASQGYTPPPCWAAAQRRAAGRAAWTQTVPTPPLLAALSGCAASPFAPSWLSSGMYCACRQAVHTRASACAAPGVSWLAHGPSALSYTVCHGSSGACSYGETRHMPALRMGRRTHTPDDKTNFRVNISLCAWQAIRENPLSANTGGSYGLHTDALNSHTQSGKSQKRGACKRFGGQPSAGRANILGKTCMACAAPQAHHDRADLLVHRAAQAQAVHDKAGQADRAQARQHDDDHQPCRRACTRRQVLSCQTHEVRHAGTAASASHVSVPALNNRWPCGAPCILLGNYMHFPTRGEQDSQQASRH